MKRILQIAAILCSLLFTPSALAEHQTYLRGIVNLPGMQVALIEIDHTRAKRSNAPPAIITTSRLMRVLQQFEDDAIRGAHFQFEVQEIDFAKETIKTREAGEEHTYSLDAPDRPASAKSWFQLQNAAFNDVIDLYSELENRVVLVHPAIDRAPLSFEAVWTNEVPEKAQAAKAFVDCLDQRGISVVMDGARFVQLVPKALNGAASPRSQDLAAEPASLALSLKNAGARELAEMYASLSGRHLVGNGQMAGSVPYLKINQGLSKPEALYVLETLLAWNGAKILLGDDNTFSIVRASR